MTVRSHSLLLMLLAGMLAPASHAADWPMWRYDANRSGASPTALSTNLYLQWVLEWPALEKAWPDESRITFDEAHAPVAAGDTLFVCSSASDSLTALNTETGSTNWRFYADAPLRFAPAVTHGKAYFSSDDGYLYCVNAADGSLVWKFRGAPADHKGLGNKRLGSLWPARGAPVVFDGRVYFAAGIWPFMGVFVYALDAADGSVLWANDTTGDRYRNQPHSPSVAFSALAPQGYLVAIGSQLLVPNGRAVAASLDRTTGEYQYFKFEANNGNSACHTAALGDRFNNSGQWFNLADGSSVGSLADGAILTTNTIYTGSIQALTTNLVSKWTYSAPGYTVFCAASNQVYAGMAGGILALEDQGTGAQLIWEKPLTGTPKNMIAAADKLFVSTAEGYIYCFGTVNTGAQPPAGDTMLVATGSVWKYLDNGSDQGAAWRAPSFDDSGWAAGPAELGYGDGDEATTVAGQFQFVTTYFRRAFPVTNAASFGRLFLNVKVDDGAVVYLNNTEVCRVRLSGAVTNLTLGADGESWTPAVVDPALLLEGTNLLAVEIHQCSLSSSDISFDLELTGSPDAAGPGWPPEDAWTTNAQNILSVTGTDDGYCLVPGAGTGRLMEELCRQSNLKIIGLDTNPASVAQLRARWQGMGLPAERISVREGEIATAGFPPYLANLVAAEDENAAGLPRGALFVERMFHSLRPYGGTICLEGDHAALFSDAIAASNLTNAEVSMSGGYTILKRVGALPGAADWTHQYADTANTAVSKDERVKPPLGLLWFGGSSNVRTLPRHGHGPSEQIVGGRLVIEGADWLRALDVYTGRVLWEKCLPGLGMRYDNTEHFPGANHLGSNYASASNGIYVCQTTTCRRLDPATGDTSATFTLPDGSWFSQAKVWNDLLIVAADPFVFTGGSVGQDNWNETSSRELVVMNRDSGDILWTRTASNAFHHNAIIIGGDMLFCIDRLPPGQVDALSRRGLHPASLGASFRLLALDVRTGSEIWSKTNNIFGTWLGYSDEYDVLLQSGRHSRDMVTGEPDGRLILYNARTGSVLWDQVISTSDDGPHILFGNRLLKQTGTSGSALDLLTGATHMRRHPLDGRSVPWSFSRTYGCNTAVGSRYLLTFRSGAAGFFDLKLNGGTGNFGGFKSGCTSNLLPAGGVLSAPDYTRTCTCSYQNQTSLAFVHMPEAEMWTCDPVAAATGPIKQVGLNLGARGDRVSDAGTLWLDYPSVGGTSPDIAVAVTGSPQYFRTHSMRLPGAGMKWVTCSGATNLSSITLGLNNPAAQPYRVNLYFSEPDHLGPSQRVFNVSLQGSQVLTNLDIALEPDPNVVVKGFGGVMVASNLTVDLTAVTGATVLCGIEATITEPPAIENGPASFVTTNSACLNGNLTFSGATSSWVRVFWDTTNHDTNMTDWAHTNDVGESLPGPLTAAISNLSPNMIYYYRFHAANGDGGAWAAATTNFTTADLPAFYSLTSVGGAGGVVAPSGPVPVARGGGTNFVMTADPHFHIASIATNGVLIGGYAYDNACTNAAFAWSNVLAHGVVSVVFSANLWTNGAPESWLLAYYPDAQDFDAAALSDTDGDGMAAWQEYVAGTVPTNAASVLRIVEIRPADTDRVAVTWSGVTYKSYAVKHSTNLVCPWLPLVTNIPGNASLNVHTADTQQAQCTFYRVVVER